LICIYRNTVQLLRGSINHPEDDETNDIGGDGGSQWQTQDKDLEHFTALPSPCGWFKQPTQLLDCFGEDWLLEERRR